MDEPNEISNSQDIIDSRDVEERIKFLKKSIRKAERYTGERQDFKDELAKLLKFKADVDNDSEWEFGITFIGEEHFEDYTMELAEDIGAIGKDANWIVIDWEATANNVKIDYTSVDFDGTTYYYR